jgi:hypothetical protein
MGLLSVAGDGAGGRKGYDYEVLYKKNEAGDGDKSQVIIELSAISYQLLAISFLRIKNRD